LDKPWARAEAGPAVGCVTGIENDGAGLVDRGSGILKAGREDAGLQRPACGIAGKIEDGRGWQSPPTAQVIVKEQPGAQHPSGPQACLMRQDKAQGPHDVRRYSPYHLALGEGLSHQPEIELPKVAQPAVDQLGGARGRTATEVAHVEQEDRQPAAGGIAGDATAIDAAADDGKVEAFRHPCSPSKRSSFSAQAAAALWPRSGPASLRAKAYSVNRNWEAR